MRSSWVSTFLMSVMVLTGGASCRSILEAADAYPGAIPLMGANPPAESRSPDTGPTGLPVQQTAYSGSSQPFPNFPDGRLEVRIRARVNGLAILDDEVKEASYPLLMRTQSLAEPQRSAQQKEIIERQLQALIDREIILSDLFTKLATMRPTYMDKIKEAAAKEFDKQVRSMKEQAQKAGANIQSEEDLAKVLRDQGLSLDEMRRQAERQFMAMEYMRSRIFPVVDRLGHEEIMEYYQQHANEFQVMDSVQWQDLFIDAGKYHSRQEARQFAQQLATRVQAGEDFKNLIKYDDGDSAYRKGEGYGQHRGEIKPVEVEPLLFKMREGEVGPVVELANGFHVIRLVKREIAGQRPLDAKTQLEIRKKLQNEVAEREYKRLLAELKRKATVEINTD